MRRAIKIVGGLLAGLVLLLIVVVGGTVVALQTDPVQRRLAGLIEDAASSPDGLQVRIGAIEGTLPVEIRLRDLELGDPEGRWLSVDRARLAWRPLDLLQGRLTVEAIELGIMAVDRLPALPPGPEEDAGGGGLPRLPVGVVVEDLSIDEVALAEPVLGEAARLSVDGSARLVSPEEGLSAELSVERLDGVTGALSAQLTYRPEAESLAVTVALEEPAGGVVARAAQLPGLPPVILSVTGSGPLDDWAATMVARAGDLGVLEADVAIADAPGGRRVALDAFALPGAALGDPLAPLLGGRPTLAAAAVLTDAGPIEIETLALETAAGRLSATGRVAPGEHQVALDWRLDAGDPAAFAALAPQADWQALALTGRIEGPFLEPSVTVAVEADAVGWGAYGAGPLALTLSADPLAPLGAEDTPIAVTLDATIADARAGIGNVDPLLSGETALSVAGTVVPDSGDVRLETARVALPAGTATATGTLEAWGAAADLTVDLSVPELAALAGLAGPLTGGADLSAAVERGEAGVRVALSGGLAEPALGIAPVDALLGDAVPIRGTVAVAPDGTVSIDRLTVDAARADLSAEGVLAGGALAVGATLSLPDLSAIDPALEGAARLTADLSGPIDDLTAGVRIASDRITAAGETLDAVSVDAVVSRLTERPAGAVSVAADWRGEPLALDTRFALTEDGGLRLEDLTIAAAGIDGGGTITVAGSGAAAGSLTLRAEDLSVLSGLAGQPLAGQATVSLDGGVGGDAGDGATVTLEAQNLAAAGATAARVTLQAAVADPLGTPRVDARLEAGGVAVAGETVSRLTATAEGGPGRGIEFTLDARGAPVTLSTAGTLRLPALAAAGDPAPRAGSTAPDGPAVTLDRLTGSFRDRPFRLTQPVTVALGESGIAIDGLRVAGEQGRIAVDGTLGEDYDLTARLEAVPLALLRLANPALAMTGRLDAELDLSGTRRAPVATLSATARDVETDAAAAAGLPGFGLQFDAAWREGRLTAESSVSGIEGGRLRAEAAVPLPAGPTGLPEPDLGAPLRASIDGRIDLALLNDFLAVGADRVGGTLNVAIDLEGPLGSPQAGGRITLADGSYQNPRLGVQLTGIQAEAVGDAQSIRLVSLTADTPAGGGLRAEGRLQLDAAAAFPGRFQVTANDARLIDTDLVDGRFNADLLLEGALGRAPTLSGTISVGRMTVRIAERLGGGVTTIDAIELNPPPELEERVAAAQRAQEEQGATAAVDLRLDLRVNAPGTVFVVGRGLDARLSGNLRVRGSANDPRIDGSLTLDRGVLEFLSKRLEFRRGEVTFIGGSRIDPAIDFEATVPAGDATAVVNVEGRASDPTIRLSSDPPLPEDEVLSRILFGKGTGDLSTFEAVQLGQQAAQLAGVLPPGSGLVENLRRGLGIDVLNVETGQSGEAAVTAGQFVSEGVFVGVEQSLGSSETNVTVEVDITDTIKLQADVGSQGQTGVGIGWQFDY